MVLLQLEIPLETVAAARPGREQGALVALNAALARQLPEDLLALVDVMVAGDRTRACPLSRSKWWTPPGRGLLRRRPRRHPAGRQAIPSVAEIQTLLARGSPAGS